MLVSCPLDIDKLDRQFRFKCGTFSFPRLAGNARQHFMNGLNPLKSPTVCGKFQGFNRTREKIRQIQSNGSSLPLLHQKNGLFIIYYLFDYHH